MKFKVIFWSILLGAHSICTVLIAMKAPAETYPVGAYGNKTHNLFLLTELEQDITIGKLVYHVHVPNFVGISHAEVKAYLDEHGITKRWADLCELWRAKTQQFFEDKKFDPGFLVAVEALGNDICACFEKNTFPSLAMLINEHKFAGTTLMVRSTGKEDTADFANAGGNETVANVDPTPQAVSAAMGKVVASYIGSKSLKQRLAVAKTEQQVKEMLGEPFVPVLLQVMVGEKLGGEAIATDNDLVKLPVSGVMFTTEAEGQTPGVTHLQTTFGHNEAVVNSLVPVDTWYIAQDGVYYPVIRNKTHRYIPVSGGGLCKEPKPNTRVDGTSFGELPTLPGPAVRMLKQLADRIQGSYRRPMDVELVVMPAEKTIYLVQARPIVFGEKHPSYVADDFVNECEEKVQGVKFGLGHGAVREVRGKNELLIEVKLDNALTSYLAMSNAERAKIACVIIKDMAAATSHAATSFRAENMPIMQLDNNELLMKWLDEPAVRVVVDIQRGLLLRPGEKIPADISASIIPGWFECPLPRQLSVRPPAMVRMPKELAEKMETLQPQDLQTWSKKPIQDLFETLKISTSAETNDAYMSLIFIMDKLHRALGLQEFARLKKKELKKYQKLGEFEKLPAQITQDIKGIGRKILLQFSISTQEIVKTIPHVKESRSLELLYHINFLQALFDQQEDPRIVDQYSLAGVIGSAQQNIAALQVAKHPEIPAEIHALKLSEKALVPEIAKRWNGFINAYFADVAKAKEIVPKEIAKIVEPQQKEAAVMLADFATFMHMLIDLGTIDMLPLWLNVVFDGVAKRDPANPGKVAGKLIGEYKKSKEFLDKLVDYQGQLDGFSIDGFADPDSFRKLWPKFQQLIGLFSSSEFLKVFENIGNPKNNIAQLAALNVMAHVVDTFDTAIKTVTGEQNYPLDKKVANFKTMISTYWDLFKRWVSLVPRRTFKAAADSIGETREQGSPLIVNKYFEFFESIFNHKPVFIRTDRRELRPFSDRGEAALRQGDDFRVNAAVINSSAAIQRFPTTSLEDFFTLTHQNLLATISTLMNFVIDMEHVELPPLVKEIQRRVLAPGFTIKIQRAATTETYMPHLQSISFKRNALLLSYNLPLRHHSARLELIYSTENSDFVELRAYYFGANAPDRWQAIYSYAEIVDALCNTKLVSREKDDFHTTICLGIKQGTNLDFLHTSLTWMTSAAFGQGTPIPDSDWTKLLATLELYKIENRARAIDLARDTIFALWTWGDPKRDQDLSTIATWLFEELMASGKAQSALNLLDWLDRPLESIIAAQDFAHKVLRNTLVPEVLRNLPYYEKSGLIREFCSHGDEEVEPIRQEWQKHIIESVKESPSLESIIKALFELSNMPISIYKKPLDPNFLQLATKFRDLFDEKLRARGNNPQTMYTQYLLPFMDDRLMLWDITIIASWFIGHCSEFVNADMTFPEEQDPLKILRSWWSKTSSVDTKDVRLKIWELSEKMRHQGPRYWNAVWIFWSENRFQFTHEREYSNLFFPALKEFTDQIKDFMEKHDWFDNYFTQDFLTNILFDGLYRPNGLAGELTEQEKASLLSIFDGLFPFLEKTLERAIHNNVVQQMHQELFKLSFNLLIYDQRVLQSLSRILQKFEHIILAEPSLLTKENFEAARKLLAFSSNRPQKERMIQVLIRCLQLNCVRSTWQKVDVNGVTFSF